MFNKYHNIRVADLYTRLRKCVDKDAVNNVVEASLILGELKRRGEHHQLMTRGLYKWFEQVNAGTLNPSIAVKFAGEDQIISRIAKLPIAQQTKIADTGTLTIAELDRAGEVVETEKQIVRMNLNVLDRVFDNGKIRTIPQQAKLLQTEKARKIAPPKTSKPLVHANKTAGTIAVGTMTLDPELFIAPMRELGYELIRRKIA